MGRVLKEQILRDGHKLMLEGLSLPDVMDLVSDYINTEKALRRSWVELGLPMNGVRISDELKEEMYEEWNSEVTPRGQLVRRREEFAESYGVSTKTVTRYCEEVEEEEVEEDDVIEGTSSAPVDVWTARSERARQLVVEGEATWDEINNACGHDLKSEWIRHKIFS